MTSSCTLTVLTGLRCARIVRCDVTAVGPIDAAVVAVTVRLADSAGGAGVDGLTTVRLLADVGAVLVRPAVLPALAEVI